MSKRTLAMGLSSLLLLLSLGISGCGMAAGPRIRFVNATAEQLRTADEQSGPVWFEFHEGDEVPLVTLFTGVVEGGSGAKAVAKRTFWIVMEKNHPVRFSFDGKTIAEANAGSASLGVGREKELNHVAVLVYVGKPEDAPAELRSKRAGR